MVYKKLVVHTDGGARGNPGPSAIGVVIQAENKGGEVEDVAAFGKVIAEGTNNVAEYTGVLMAFSYLFEKGIQAKHVEVCMDSQLIVSQLSGVFKITKPHLKELFLQVKQLEKKVGELCHYVYIPRAQNSQADALVNKALDELA